MFSILLTSFVFAKDLAPKTVMIEMEDLPRSYLAQTGMERCKDKYAIEQERANKICWSLGHLEAVEQGYEVIATTGDEALLKARRYDFIDVEPKVYKCKKERRNRIFLHYTKFVKINCLTL